MARQYDDHEDRRSELEPFLGQPIPFGNDEHNLQRRPSAASQISRIRSNTITSIRSGYEIVKEHMDKKKFAYLVLASFFLYLGFVGAFAPRTSLARDLRRIHSTRLTEAEVYRIYLTALDDKNLARGHARNYTNHSHNIGDAHALDYTVSQLRGLGFEPKLEKYYPWVSAPIDTQVALLEDGMVTFNASMIEDCVEGDPTSCSSEKTAAYHGYSANGNVTARYVFCNYGTLEDYKFLLANEIDIEGKIHIIRHGKLFRGLKVKNAELYGASGVILYTDTYDDGYVTRNNGFETYPNGPARDESSIERGSVGFLTDFPGDPTTPGYSSKYPTTGRLSPAGKIPRIPSVPMSAKEVAPLLHQLNGRGVKVSPEGNIKGFNYFTGPSSKNDQIRLYNEQKYSIVEMTNVVVEIGGIFSEYDILIGNHRDSWTVGGAGNPNSGSAVLLEVARGMSELLKHGWKPLRPIKLISWDGGELGMLGSTEYAENHSELLKRNALAYLNLDSAITGSQFNCKSNPLLREVIRSAAKYTDFKGRDDWTLFDEWNVISNATSGMLDGIADYVPFQYHLGIPSANFEFKNNMTGDAVFPYHSTYDSYSWMEKFIDKDYKMHNTLAVLTGMTALMLSEKEPTTFKTSPYLEEIFKWYGKLHKKLLKTFPYDRELHDLAETVMETLGMARSQETVLFDAQNIELSELCTQDFAAWQFYKKIKIYMQLTRANNKLKQLDQMFLTHRGLQDRKWMKHSIYAPDKQVGCKVDVLPGLHEAILERDRDGVLQWLAILMTQFTNLRSLLQS